MAYRLPIGANVTPDGTHFRVWAAIVQAVDVVVYAADGGVRVSPMQPAGDGFYTAELAGVAAGTRYSYRLNGVDDRPDPASRFQPAGVHGPSEVVDPAGFAWNDRDWRGVALEDAIIYELHVGTFTSEGTFDAAIAKLDALCNLGVTAIEIMPVADFPGERNWGYDGVCLFAPSRAYGGPAGLRRLVAAAHVRGLAVLLDVVYNHFGPDGNYLRQFSAQYFTHHHTTPWGDALNFDDVGSEPVRAFFSANACYWANEYHLDGLRFDATHTIKDDSPTHILAEIVATVRQSLAPDRQFLFVAEDERNEPMLVRSPQPPPSPQPEGRSQEPGARGQESGNRNPEPRPPTPAGYGLDAVWADDFHHELRVALTGEREGYYSDYSGSTADLAATLRQGWFFSGQRSAWLDHPRGAPANDIAPPAFLHAIQNHDQVGNRALGDRLNAVIGLDAYRAASALLLCSPYLPMLWAGQEWAATTPFLFFTDHNPELGKLVTEGRRREFERFAAFAGEQVPDPQAEDTFLRSKLDWGERTSAPHAGVLRLHRDLLRLRRESPALRARGRDTFAVEPLGDAGLVLTQRGGGETLLLVVNLRGAQRYPLDAHIAAPAAQRWATLLSTEDPQYGGDGDARLDGTSAIFAGLGALLLRAE